MAAICWGTRNRDKRLALIQGLLVDVKEVPVVALSLQPADDPRREAMLRAGWIKNVDTLLPVQTRTDEMSKLAVCKSLIVASAACWSGRSAASLLTGRWRNSSTLIEGPFGHIVHLQAASSISNSEVTEAYAAMDERRAIKFLGHIGGCRAHHKPLCRRRVR